MTIDIDAVAGSAGNVEIRRALSRLSQKGAWAEACEDDTAGAVLVSPGGSARAEIAGPVWGELERHGWAAVDAGGQRWTISALGREHLKRLLSRCETETGTPSPAAPARATSPRPEPANERPGFDLAECPVAWLARRRDKSGQPLISGEQLAAAERLRADFWFAGMTPRVTTNWAAALGGGATPRSAPGAGVEIRDAVIAAGERVHRALAAVGPDLAGILIDVCCHLKGLEVVERKARWPQRSAKIILGIALTSLARHYGLDKGRASSGGRSTIRHWGSEDYRPAIDAGSVGGDGAALSAAGE